MFVLHKVDDSCPSDVVIKWRDWQMEFRRGIFGLKDDAGMPDVVPLIDALLLKLANDAGWDVAPNTDGFADALRDFGYVLNNEAGTAVQGSETETEASFSPPRDGTDPATGSPWKRALEQNFNVT